MPPQHTILPVGYYDSANEGLERSFNASVMLKSKGYVNITGQCHKSFAPP